MLTSLKGLATPLDAPGARPVAGSPLPRTFRLRAGSYRVLGEWLPTESAVLATVAFRKRREKDYRSALIAHARRVHELAGPSPSDARAGREGDDAPED